mmetsp:Transcript_1606/g.3306  ORF Transcript_1606/g.3306 Transcript_1606/m.3306 type:complete len:186 (+) Transcript_1606:56-613(+)
MTLSPASSKHTVSTAASSNCSSLRSSSSMDIAADWLLAEGIKEGSGPTALPPTPARSLLGNRACRETERGEETPIHTCELHGGVTYAGGWQQGRPEGFGEMQWPDGRRFVGIFSAGLRAQGRMVYADGHEYNGSWMNNLPHGFGTASFQTETWGGEWDRGRPMLHGSCGSSLSLDESLDVRKVFL